MKKTIPFMISVLAIAAIASTAVLGNTQTAYAGNGCTIDPPTVSVTLADDESSNRIQKTIDCFEDIIPFVDTLGIEECETVGIDVGFPSSSIDLGVWTADEIITNSGVAPGTMEHCMVQFNVDFIEGGDTLFQEIWVTAPAPPVVGGEFLPIDSTALVLAGLQTSAIWLAPIVISAVGIGLIFLRKRI